jgi:phenylalanyl-tRNA synthetase alpha chain
MNERLKQLREEYAARVAQAADIEALEKYKVALLGRKGALTEILRGLSSLPIEERRPAGEAANKLRAEMEALIDAKTQELRVKALSHELTKSKVEISPLFAFPFPQGHYHPLRQTIDTICNIFRTLGFNLEVGPEIETDWYNFEALNIPKDHPARDTQDTFYIEGGNGRLLRTHTSPVQCHVMEKQQPPLRVIVPGRVFRNEATDASHSAIFHQVEGLAVDRHVTFADLKGTITLFVSRMFGSKLKLRFRPSHFQFTEPSAEVDVQCVMCGGRGCRVCKGSGWLEMLGCGMVHPNVFRAVNYDPEIYTGFAFGIGVERFAMIQYDVDDMRLFYENNLKFLRQF